MFKVKDGFSCDRQSKYDFTASTVSYIDKMYNNVSVVFKEFDKNGLLVEFDSPASHQQSRTDLVMYINDYCYVVELKERWGKYTSNFYGKDEDEEGWMLNIDKVTELKRLAAIPLYVNLYPDNKVRIWNLNNIENYNTITKPIHKTTVIESEIKQQDRYEVWNKDSKIFDRVKGNKSNGVWRKGAN